MGARSWDRPPPPSPFFLRTRVAAREASPVPAGRTHLGAGCLRALMLLRAARKAGAATHAHAHALHMHAKGKVRLSYGIKRSLPRVHVYLSLDRCPRSSGSSHVGATAGANPVRTVDLWTERGRDERQEVERRAKTKTGERAPAAGKCERVQTDTKQYPRASCQCSLLSFPALISGKPAASGRAPATCSAATPTTRCRGEARSAADVSSPPGSARG